MPKDHVHYESNDDATYHVHLNSATSLGVPLARHFFFLFLKLLLCLDDFLFINRHKVSNLFTKMKVFFIYLRVAK